MAISDGQELLKLVQNQVDLGFILLETYRLSMNSSHVAHAAQALKNAGAAWESASGFLHRLTKEEADGFRPRLLELGAAIQSHGSTAEA